MAILTKNDLLKGAEIIQGIQQNAQNPEKIVQQKTDSFDIDSLIGSIDRNSDSIVNILDKTDKIMKHPLIQRLLKLKTKEGNKPADMQDAEKAAGLVSDIEKKINSRVLENERP